MNVGEKNWILGYSNGCSYSKCGKKNFIPKSKTIDKISISPYVNENFLVIEPNEIEMEMKLKIEKNISIGGEKL